MNNLEEGGWTKGERENPEMGQVKKFIEAWKGWQGVT